MSSLEASPNLNPAIRPVATHMSMQNGQVMSSPTAFWAPLPRTSSFSSAGPSWPW